MGKRFVSSDGQVGLESKVMLNPVTNKKYQQI